MSFGIDIFALALLLVQIHTMLSVLHMSRLILVNMIVIYTGFNSRLGGDWNDSCDLHQALSKGINQVIRLF